MSNILDNILVIICHQLIIGMHNAKDPEGLKEGLFGPLFPPRQWPIKVTSSCSALKACKLRNCIVAMLQVSVALTTASVKEVRSSAATLSPYMETNKMRRRQKEMRKEMMKMIKAIECDVLG